MPLLKAINKGDYKLAEEILEGLQDPSLLNKGPCFYNPLHLALNTYYHGHFIPRNLRLARLLVLKGANPNLYLSREYSWQNRTPFEQLVVYNQLLKSYVRYSSNILDLDLIVEFLYPIPDAKEEDRIKILTNTIDLHNELCEPNIEGCHKMIKQTDDLIDVFLECGGDPNVITKFNHRTLFQWVVKQKDVALARRFLNTCRVNLNNRDHHGNSPLMDVIVLNDPEDSLVLYEAMCDTGVIIDINASNCCRQTALYRAVLMGAVQLALQLCDSGADRCTMVNLGLVPPMCFGLSEIIPNPHLVIDCTTPLVAPLLFNSPARERYAHVCTYDFCYNVTSEPSKDLADKIISSCISPLIDCGYFCTQDVAANTISLLSCDQYRHLKEEAEISAAEMITLMFGQVSCGLRQLCVRTVYDTLLSRIHTMCDPACSDSCDLLNFHNVISNSALVDLLEALGLPQSFRIFFELEAAKYLIAGNMLGLMTTDCERGCSESDDEDDDNDSMDSSGSSVISSDHCDSLHFFSSDMLSEESSEEEDDLSDEVCSSTEDEETEEEGARVEEQRGDRYQPLSDESTTTSHTPDEASESVAECWLEKTHSERAGSTSAVPSTTEASDSEMSPPLPPTPIKTPLSKTPPSDSDYGP